MYQVEFRFHKKDPFMLEKYTIGTLSREPGVNP